MNIFNQIFNTDCYKDYQNVRGIQNVYTPIDKIEEATGFEFNSLIDSSTKEVGVLFNFEFIENIIKKINKDYINNIHITFFYDSIFDLNEAKFICSYNNFENISFESIEDFSNSKNIKDLEKTMANKKFDVIFSNPPYSGPREAVNIDVKIFNEVIKYTTELFFIMPCACFISHLWKDTRKTHPDVIAKNYLPKLEKIVIFEPNKLFNGLCAKEADIAILHFNNNKEDKTISYIDTKYGRNINKALNDFSELHRFTSYSDNFTKNLATIKTKIDNWIENKTDFFSHHANGGDYGRKPMNVEKLTMFANNLSAYHFWLPAVNGGTCQYMINDVKNEWFCAINRGDEHHYKNNFYIEKDINFIFNLGSARIIFNASSEEDAERNWKFITHSPIAKLIMVFYREDRNIYYKWFPWLNENKSFNELCEEIKFSEEEIKFIKDFFKDIKPISWD